MSEIQDRSYYSDRAKQEAEAAKRAIVPASAAVHSELAYRYSLLAKGIPTLAPRLQAARG